MLIVVVGSMSAYSADMDQLLKAIATVESNNNDSAVGDCGKAIGRYQIWESYVSDVNRFAKTTFTWEDAKDPKKAKVIVTLYLNHYGKRYTKLTGKPVTPKVLSRIHNGGPNGFRKSVTLKYWDKVKEQYHE